MRQRSQGRLPALEVRQTNHGGVLVFVVGPIRTSTHLWPCMGGRRSLPVGTQRQGAVTRALRVAASACMLHFACGSWLMPRRDASNTGVVGPGVHLHAESELFWQFVLAAPSPPPKDLPPPSLESSLMRRVCDASVRAAPERASDGLLPGVGQARAGACLE